MQIAAPKSSPPDSKQKSSVSVAIGTIKLTWAQHYLFFVFTMLAAATIFSMLAWKYLPKDFVQEKDDPDADLEAEVEMH